VPIDYRDRDIATCTRDRSAQALDADGGAEKQAHEIDRVSQGHLGMYEIELQPPEDLHEAFGSRAVGDFAPDDVEQFRRNPSNEAIDGIGPLSSPYQVLIEALGSQWTAMADLEPPEARQGRLLVVTPDQPIEIGTRIVRGAHCLIAAPLDQRRHALKAGAHAMAGRARLRAEQLRGDEAHRQSADAACAAGGKGNRRLVADWEYLAGHIEAGNGLAVAVAADKGAAICSQNDAVVDPNGDDGRHVLIPAETSGPPDPSVADGREFISRGA